MTGRPATLVAVAGTGTEVGKTWFAARLAEALVADGLTVGARKPAQSFDPSDAHPTDAAVLAAATGESAADVCRPELAYPVALAPPMAAAALGRPVPTLADLAAACAWPSAAPAVGLVELAGGVRSPMAADGDGVDFIAALGPDGVLLVADAGLGTINAVRLALAALGADRPVLVVLNRYEAADDLHRRNREWLGERDHLAVATDVAGARAWLAGLS